MRGARKIERVLRRVLRRSDRNLVFVHLPKCGGTSLHRAMARRYSRHAVTRLLSRSSKRAADRAGRELLAYRRDLLIYELERGGSGRFLSGHWALDAGVCEAYRSRFTFVTVLRDPVERWLSHFFHNASAAGPFRIDEPLDDFLSAPRARLLGSVYVRQLNGGAVDESGGIGPRAVRAACRTLDALDLVGTLERLDSFCAAFRSRWGVRLDVGLERPGGPARSRPVTREQRGRIETLCAGDLEVYAHAAGLAAGPAANG